MSDRLKCTARLNKLLESNFFVAKCYRKMMKIVEDESLQTFFRKKASRRFQFAIELSEEIGFLKQSYSSYGPFSPARRSLGISDKESLQSIFSKAIHNDLTVLKKYRKAMSEINEGATREILIRHIAAIEKSVRDLQTLKSMALVQTKDAAQSNQTLTN